MNLVFAGTAAAGGLLSLIVVNVIREIWKSKTCAVVVRLRTQGRRNRTA